MKKTIYTKEYEILLQVLRSTRHQAGLTQVSLAEALGATQAFVSKIERGDRRIDMVELRTICRAIGVSLATFVESFEAELAKGS